MRVTVQSLSGCAAIAFVLQGCCSACFHVHGYVDHALAAAWLLPVDCMECCECSCVTAAAVFWQTGPFLLGDVTVFADLYLGRCSRDGVAVDIVTNGQCGAAIELSAAGEADHVCLQRLGIYVQTCLT